MLEFFLTLFILTLSSFPQEEFLLVVSPLLISICL